MNRASAARELALMLFREGIETGVEAFFDSFSNPVGYQKEKRERIRRWYNSLTEEGQETFRVVVSEAMVLAVFGIAVHLVGDTGGIRAGDRDGEFWVTLKLWRQGVDTWKDAPEETVDICPTKRGEDIHDLFMDLVDEWEEKRTR